jgi:hypothetical protein
MLFSLLHLLVYIVNAKFSVFVTALGAATMDQEHVTLHVTSSYISV